MSMSMTGRAYTPAAARFRPTGVAPAPAHLLGRRAAGLHRAAVAAERRAAALRGRHGARLSARSAGQAAAAARAEPPDRVGRDRRRHDRLAGVGADPDPAGPWRAACAFHREDSAIFRDASARSCRSRARVGSAAWSGDKLPDAQKQLGGVASGAAGWIAGFLTSLWSGGKALIGGDLAPGHHADRRLLHADRLGAHDRQGRFLDAGAASRDGARACARDGRARFPASCAARRWSA